MKIEIKNLSKIYPNGNHAIKGVNLTINSGMFGLLGPNGAGKSSLMRILVTLNQPTSGQILVDGMDIQKHRKEIRSMLGYLPQEFRFFAKLKTHEFLEYAARLAGMNKKRTRLDAVEKMLEEVGLYEARNRMAEDLSGGMKRRLGIAQALIGDPKMIIVDEPTTGLDPQERIRFRNLLTNISEKDVIIILSTHIVGDISSTCNDMALLNKGELAYNGSPDELINMARENVWKIEATEKEYFDIQDRFPVISTIPNAHGWEIQVVAKDLGNYKGVRVEPNLEHAYVNYMEHEMGIKWLEV